MKKEYTSINKNPLFLFKMFDLDRCLLIYIFKPKYLKFKFGAHQCGGVIEEDWDGAGDATMDLITHVKMWQELFPEKLKLYTIYVSSV